MLDVAAVHSGNDLESICGQVASGCNLIAFTTGNGSITNFPFVPTVKIVSSSARFAHVQAEMDVDAGQVCQRASKGSTAGPSSVTDQMCHLAPALGRLFVSVASGARTKGEYAGHSQVQLWRAAICAAGAVGMETIPRVPGGESPALGTEALEAAKQLRFDGLVQGQWGPATWDLAVAEPVALVIPTSLCSSAACEKVARSAWQRVCAKLEGAERRITRVCVLAHTEGCGVSDHTIATTALVNYALHPAAAAVLMVEHGCEGTHADHFRRALREATAGGTVPPHVTFASVQGGGGLGPLERATMEWLLHAASAPAPMRSLAYHGAGVGNMALGVVLVEGMSTSRGLELVAAVGRAAALIIAEGGAVVVPGDAEFTPPTPTAVEFWREARPPSIELLGFGEALKGPGVHSMALPHADLTLAEKLSGLAASGATAILLLAAEPVHMLSAQGHPLVPTISAACVEGPAERCDCDIRWPEAGADAPEAGVAILQRLATFYRWQRTETMAGGDRRGPERCPVLLGHGRVMFQLPRGPQAISL